MRRHVIRAFVRMTEQWVAIGDEAGQESLEVASDLGVGVFANDQRRAGVLHENMAQAASNATFPDHPADSIIDPVESASAGRDLQKRLHNHGGRSLGLVIHGVGRRCGRCRTNADIADPVRRSRPGPRGTFSDVGALLSRRRPRIGRQR